LRGRNIAIKTRSRQLVIGTCTFAADTVLKKVNFFEEEEFRKCRFSDDILVRYSTIVIPTGAALRGGVEGAGFLQTS